MSLDDIKRHPKSPCVVFLALLLKKRNKLSELGSAQPCVHADAQVRFQLRFNAGHGRKRADGG